MARHRLVGLAALAAYGPRRGAGRAATGGAPAMTTVVGRGVLDGPGGIALDSAGDLCTGATGPWR